MKRIQVYEPDYDDVAMFVDPRGRIIYENAAAKPNATQSVLCFGFRRNRRR